MRWPKYWSFSLASFLPKKSQGGSPSEWTGWISLQSKGLSRVFSNTTVQKYQFFGTQPTSQSNSHMITGKTTALTRRILVGKVMSLLLNMLSRLVITFLPRSVFNFMAAITIYSDFGAQNTKSDTASTVPHLFPMKWWDQMLWSLFSECWALSQFFHSPFTFIKRIFSSSSLSAIRVVLSAYLRWLIFLPAILIPPCASSSPVFLMMYSACKLNKQDDNIKPWRTPFPI